MKQSMLDTDLYIFTMGVFAKYNHENVVAEYAFKCRNDVNLSNLIYSLKSTLVNFVNNTTFTNSEIDYLNKKLQNKAEYLREFTKKPLPIYFGNFTLDVIGHEIIIRVYGPLWAYIFIEVPLLSKINELFNNINYTAEQRVKFEKTGNELLTEKIKLLNENPGVKIMEFGTRRRYSKEWQKHVLHRLLLETTNVVSTSNVGLARDFKINPAGTTAHLYSQTYQALTNPIDSQRQFFKEWAEFWKHDFLIALTDVFPQQKFLKDFTKDLAEQYNGVRHDSGDPFVWCREIIEHYIKLGIDPKTKTAIFSDGLDIPLCIKLYNEFKDQINVIFGVGTNLTNDMGNNHVVLQIVMKVVKINGKPVAKISNNPAKSMCEDQAYVTWLNEEIEKDINNEY